MKVLEHCQKKLINFLFIYIFLVFERVLPQSLRAIAVVTIYFSSIVIIIFLLSNGWYQQVGTTLGISACAVHGTVDKNNSLSNTYRHTISVPTNVWAIYGWATGRANDGNTGVIELGMTFT